MNQNTGIKKSCEGCVFAEMDEGGHQIECYLKRIEKFKQNGAVVTKPNDSKYFDIHNRYCSTYRPKRWFSLEKINPETPIEQLEILVRKEILNTFTAVILLSHEEWNTTPTELIKPIVDSLNNQLLKPSKIVVIINKNLSPIPIIKILKEQSIPFRVEVIEDRMDDGSYITEYEALDIAVKKMDTTFYTLTSKEVPEEYFANIDEAINDKLLRFLMVYSSNIWTLNVEAHKKFGGSGLFANDGTLDKQTYEDCLDRDIFNRIFKALQAQKSEYLAIDYNKIEEICTAQ